MKRTRRSYIWEFLKSAIYVFRYKILRIKPPTNRIGKYKEITKMCIRDRLFGEYLFPLIDKPIKLQLENGVAKYTKLKKVKVK